MQMLKLSGIEKEYVIKNNGLKVNALCGINLVFGDKGLVAVTGRSGSGKTTLLNMIGGMDKPTSGNIYIDSENLNSYKEADCDFYRNFYVSIIFQDYNLLSDYTVVENIKLACRLQGESKENVIKKSLEALQLVGMRDLADRKINSLSGGQQQRVAIARAIAKDSRIVLCDEPTGNLDSKTAVEIFELLKEISKDRLVITVTHDREFADKFSDRIIVLCDGKVTEDRTVSEPVQSSERIEETKRATIHNQKKKRQGISVKDTALLIKDNFVKGVFSNVFIVILLIAAIALTSVFLSLSMYNQEDAFVSTLKANDYSVLQLSKYIDYPREETDTETGEVYIEHGPVIFYDRADINDIEKLISITGDKACYYPSYFFEKNLQDFTEEFIFTDKTSFQYEALSFREIVAVEDFSTFHLKLIYGQNPKNTNDILIYDYMANSLFYYGLFSCSMENLIGKSLIDRITGLNLTICGIIKSDYDRYAYIKKDNNTYEFEETYLTSLQTVFCKSEFINLIATEKGYDSVFNCIFVNNDTDLLLNSDIKKFKYVNLDEINFLATIDNYNQERGIIADLAAVAFFMGVDIGDVNENIAAQFLEKTYLSGIDSVYDTSIERSYLIGYSERIIGVANEVFPKGVLYHHTPNTEDLYMSNLEFRQIYLSLGSDWKANKEILKNFAFSAQNNSFYNDNPDYYFEGYTDYTPYGILIQDADYYLVSVKNFAKLIMIILICITLLGIFFFAALTIRKHSYKIGVLKATGAGNASIALIFGAQLILMTFIAYLLSIPTSFIVMKEINATFVNAIHSDLVFFAVKSKALVLMFAFSFVSVAISSFIPLVNLYYKTPTTIIRNNNRK